MIAAICSALGVSRALGWLVAAGALVAAIAGLYFAVHHSGERAGEAKVTARVEHAHTAAVAEARQDERTAADASATIASSVAAQTVGSAAVTHHIIEDLRNAIDAVSAPADASAPLPAAPVDQLRASLNAGIDRANRAADAADALP